MKQILKISKDVLEDYILLIAENSDSFFNLYKPKDILYADELNFIDCSGYTVINGVYKFYNRKTMLEYMHNYGITCGCERRVIQNRIRFFYNGQMMSQEQYNFIKNRSKMLNYKNIKGCGCAKNKR